MSRVHRISISLGRAAPKRFRPGYIIPVFPKNGPSILVGWLSVIGIAILLSGLAILAAHFSFTPIPNSAKTPPSYPGAEQVTMERSDACGKKVTYRTNNDNRKVLAFYSNVLTRDGWSVDDSSSRGIYYGWQGPSYAWHRTTFYGNILDSYSFHIDFKGYSKTQVRLWIDYGCPPPDLVGYRWSFDEWEGSSVKGNPTAPESPLNITRKDYDEALAKWHASAIEEYQITINTLGFAGGSRTLRVSDQGAKIAIIATGEMPSPNPDPETIRSIREYTVDGMFASVKNLLDDGKVIQSGATMNTRSSSIAYKVEFDPDLGFPVRIDVPRYDHGIRATIVYEFRIVKRSVYPLTIQK